MNHARKQRLSLILLMLLGVGLAVYFILQAFQENLMFYYSPQEVQAGQAPDNREIRVGGLVVKGSVQRSATDLMVTFQLTDTKAIIDVRYEGILPDLFREGQGIIANGRLLPDGSVQASQVLAKHDENYMPPEVADSLHKAGQMQ